MVYVLITNIIWIYIHWKPVKHGWVDSVNDWPHSSFHQHVRNRLRCSSRCSPHPTVFILVLLKISIEKIINKEDSDFSHAEKDWIDLSPYLWEKAILKRKYI